MYRCKSVLKPFTLEWFSIAKRWTQSFAKGRPWSP